MSGTVKVFSVGVQDLCRAIIQNEWEPKLLKSPESVEKLVRSDTKLNHFLTGVKENDDRLFKQTYEYANFLVTQQLETDQKGNYKPRVVQDDDGSGAYW